MFIYRVATTRSAKSLSLHKIQDYITGLSFHSTETIGRFIKFDVDDLIKNNYIVEFNSFKPMVNIWTDKPYIEPNAGVQLDYPEHHVSVWHQDHTYWLEWHEADKTNSGTIHISKQLADFFALGELSW